MIDILWVLFLLFFGLMLLSDVQVSDAWTYSKERFWLFVGTFSMIAALFCGGLAMYITSKTCEDSVVAKAAGISDRCYKGGSK